MADANTKQRFEAAELARTRNACLLGDSLCAVGHLLYPIADYFVVKGSLVPITMLRVGWIIFFALHAFFVFRKTIASRCDALVTFSAACLSVVSVTLATHQPSCDYILVLSIVMVCSAIFIPLTSSYLLVGWSSSVVLYNAAAAYLGLIESSARLVVHDAFLAMSGMTAYVVYTLGNRLRVDAFCKSENLASSNLFLKDVVDRLRLANTKLQQLDVLRNETFANLSHEFRTPISVVKGCLQSVLRMADVSEGARKQLTIAERWITRALGMFNELLDLTKLDNAAQPLLKTRFDLADMLRELTDMSMVHTDKRKIGVHCDFPTSFIVEVVAEKKLIERMCTNLIGNAIKYTDDGGRITTRIAIHDGRVNVTVEDTGIGIDPADWERVFGRFVQIQTDGRPSRGGVGIGLSLCKSIARAHGGDTTITSVVGVGSKIGFWIPLPTAEELEKTRLDEVAEIVKEPTSTRTGLDEWNEADQERREYRFRKIEDSAELRVLSRKNANRGAPKVLLVEDNPDIVRMIESMIGGEYSLQQASDGVKAIEMVERFRPDLILTDVTMPNMDGEEMIKRLRSEAYGATIPVIVLTAKGTDVEKQRLIEAGADYFMQKGFDIDELLSVLRTQLKRQVSGKKLAEDERTKSLRAMAGGIAHEILNPINLAGNYLMQIHVNLEKLKAEPTVSDATSTLLDKIERALNGIESNRTRVKSAVEPLRRISRGKENEGPMELQSLNDIVAEVLKAVDTKNDIVSNLDATRHIMAQVGQLEQVAVNLIINAQQACGDQKSRPIEVKTQDVDGGLFAEMTVKDYGPGMSMDTLSRIFDPYFTTKPTGTGLGLNVCREIVTLHGGTLAAESTPGEGALFRMRIPAAATSLRK